MAKARIAAVEPACAELAEKMGLELVDLSLDREPTGAYLRLYIDRPEGISLDDCEKYHKAVRSLVEPIDFDFMEVSSPGIDRPLKKERDFERALGSEIEIRLFKAIDGAKVLSGVLAGYENDEIILETPEGERRIARKAAALVKPIVDMEGIEEVDLSGDEQTDSEYIEESGEKS